MGGIRTCTVTAVMVFVAGLTALAQSQNSSGDAPATGGPALQDFSHGVSAFPGVLNPYRPGPITPLVLANSSRLHDLIRDGRLRLSLSNALALAIENNLDIAVQRYLRPIAEADMLRTSSGQAARGISGALVPSGLSAGALGVGVNQTGGTGGVGSAGGISGGGGAIAVGQSGTFDPAVSINASFDRTVAPLNSLVVAGVPQVTTSSAAATLNYSQLFADGSSFTMATNGIAQNSTQQSLLFNPADVSRVAMGFNQPLLNGFGLLPNKRFVIVATNNLQTSEHLFRAQVTSTVVQIENAYWDLTASRQAIATAQRAVDAARELEKDTLVRLELGTAAGIDVTSSQSAAAAAERDLIVAQTNFQLQQAQLKNLISKESDPGLDAADIETTDDLPDPGARALPDLQSALADALAHRPELQVARQDLQNQSLTTRFTRNGMLPSVSAFGLFAGAGLTGQTPVVANGLGASFAQDFSAAYPEYGAGVSANIPLRNRAAQADNLRARLEEQQLTVQMQRSRQQIGLEVRQALISLTQGRAQVEAAHEALRLALRTVEAERAKLQAGVSTTYDVILRERDELSARQADVAASAAYAKALVDFDRATGAMLERNGIELRDALAGETHAPPVPAMLHSGAGSRQ
ncbi:MAG: TolC family protein [Acidobacteriia bacterium]|nr:TolC family protein [Terriglobia bacterium]